MDVDKTVAELKQLTQTELNESNIVKNGNVLLTQLRKHWHVAKDDFSSEIILDLKNLGQLISNVDTFIEELDEFPYLQTQEDVDETISNLYSVVEQTEGLAVSKRVLKEIRELATKRKQLPNAKEKHVSQVVASAISTLSAQTPDCKKCGSKMRLRDGRGYYFWGCSTFPTCWSRKYLKKEELALFER